MTLSGLFKVNTGNEEKSRCSCRVIYWPISVALCLNTFSAVLSRGALIVGSV